MRKHFQSQLDQLNEDLIQMGILIEKSLQKVIDILDTQDEVLLNEIKKLEVQVDEYERQVQSQALRILFTQQPVAKDLRSISTAIYIITDMERIADQAYDIAKTAMYFKNRKTIDQPSHIIDMISSCINMVSKSVNAFVAQNMELAQEVINSDDSVDTLFKQVRDDLIDMINQNKECGEQAIDFIMIAKYLERIADHAVNIAEWVIFNITGAHKNQVLL